MIDTLSSFTLRIQTPPFHTPLHEQPRIDAFLSKQFSLLLRLQRTKPRFQLPDTIVHVNPSGYIYYICIFLLATAGNPSSTRKGEN
ncbi:hypothetical protein L1987_71756 [Smallanthus sonchifolius]|uniref:Uncharacterized protein n=1 Tax=Smallanthus sonchifolius TaxID=185202 RepID=A0ACB9ATY6_9ASTR|nr:hypothetical protein L1987_71756 [Smallanthus sonchifolius]